MTLLLTNSTRTKRLTVSTGIVQVELAARESAMGKLMAIHAPT